MNVATKEIGRNSLYAGDAFDRADETHDALFYARDRFVSHLDSLALTTVERIIETLIVEEEPIILDLMAGWDSHIPDRIRPFKVVGLGLNRNELAENPALSEYVIHDLNRDPRLPFPDASFDVVLNTVSVDYMTRPFEVFADVARILKPGGLFLVVFSNRMFPQKAVNLWRRSGELERVILVEDFFGESGLYEDPKVYVSKGKPRPEDDKYAHLGIPSDPIYAVYADRKGSGFHRRSRPVLELDLMDYGFPDAGVIDERRKRTRYTRECPYCGRRMNKWMVPHNPFTDWTNEFMYVCFNDDCPYFRKGWDVMNLQGNLGFSYRLMYHPEKDSFFPVPVPGFKALRESIVDND